MDGGCSGYGTCCLAFKRRGVRSATGLQNRAARWHILRGVLHGSSTESTYVFCNEVLGYNLADFFNRYSDTLRTEILSIIRDLLT